jgi:transposase
MRSIGLDVHKRFAEVAILGPGERQPQRRRINVTPQALRAFAATLGPDDQVVLEATTNTWAVAELLSARAGRVVVSNPLRTRAIAAAKVKTDKVDALILAQLLAADFVPQVWVPDPATLALRREVARRTRLVRERTRLRNMIHAVLHRALVDAPHSDLFGLGGQRWLAQVPLASEDREEIAAVLRLLVPLDEEILSVERRLARRALDEAAVTLLMTIPGIAHLTALALVAVIGDVARFTRPTNLVGYLGLDPRVRQSGERPARTGAISHQGSAHARGLLVEAAHSAVRTPGPLHSFFARLRARRGAQKAIVAVARKLAVISWHVLRSGQPYRWPSTTLVRKKQRGLELALGIPARRAVRAAGEPTIAQRRVADLARAAAAEAEYRQLVAARVKRTDAAAALGRDDAGPRTQMRGGASPKLRSSLRGQAASGDD